VRANYAGGYRFVEPDLLSGTLRRGFDAFAVLTDPLHRAIAMMFLLTECHPFDDGNGRVARLLANAELSRAGQVRLVIPTAYRDNYLAALTGTSHGAGHGESLVSTLQYAQRWTAAIDWSDYEQARDQIERTNGFLDPGLAESTGRRLRLPD
jgi:Fic/DOC family